MFCKSIKKKKYNVRIIRVEETPFYLTGIYTKVTLILFL